MIDESTELLPKQAEVVHQLMVNEPRLRRQCRRAARRAILRVRRRPDDERGERREALRVYALEASRDRLAETEEEGEGASLGWLWFLASDPDQQRKPLASLISSAGKRWRRPIGERGLSPVEQRTADLREWVENLLAAGRQGVKVQPERCEWSAEDESAFRETRRAVFGVEATEGKLLERWLLLPEVDRLDSLVDDLCRALLPVRRVVVVERPSPVVRKVRSLAGVMAKLHRKAAGYGVDWAVRRCGLSMGRNVNIDVRCIRLTVLTVDDWYVA